MKTCIKRWHLQYDEVKDNDRFQFVCILDIYGLSARYHKKMVTNLNLYLGIIQFISAILFFVILSFDLGPVSNMISAIFLLVSTALTIFRNPAEFIDEWTRTEKQYRSLCIKITDESFNTPAGFSEALDDFHKIEYPYAHYKWEWIERMARHDYQKSQKINIDEHPSMLEKFAKIFLF